MKFNSPLTNTVIFHNALGIADIVRKLQAEGWKIEPEDLAEISPYLTEHIMRFGEYSADKLTLAQETYEVHLDIDFSWLDPGAASADPEAEAA